MTNNKTLIEQYFTNNLLKLFHEYIFLYIFMYVFEYKYINMN